MLQRFCLVVGVPVGVVFHHVLGLGHTCTLFRCQLQALHGTATPVLVLIPVLVEVLDLALVPALEEFEVLSGLQTPCYWIQSGGCGCVEIISLVLTCTILSTKSSQVPVTTKVRV